MALARHGRVHAEQGKTGKNSPEGFLKITIEGASEEFERKLLALLADHRHELAVAVDTEWDAERAALYLLSLPANAQRFARLVVDADGTKPAEELREEFHGELRGPTIALSRAVPRGVRRGWWPEGTAAPVTPTYDPDHPSWQKAIAYTMTSENVTVFRQAFEQLADRGSRLSTAGTIDEQTVRRAHHEAESDGGEPADVPARLPE
ncbi:hypothetical protein ACFV6G_39155 [Streptomyces lavendulae]|uniref:hypothetical protein n=1 Tax=Streptomyces lavendulae TaxID=1914 RepID=UPI0036773A63